MSKINCSKVYLRESSINPSFDGVFAGQDFKKGDIIEIGIVRIVNIDGNYNPHVFTWSDEIPNKTWAIGSGCSTFYNTSLAPNTQMNRNFDNNTFTIEAITNISKGQELFHKYKSLKWRKCFQELNNTLNST